MPLPPLPSAGLAFLGGDLAFAAAFAGLFPLSVDPFLAVFFWLFVGVAAAF